MSAEAEAPAISASVMLTAAAAAVAQMVDKAVDAVADGSHQNQNNNDVCHKKTSQLVLSNST